MFTGSPKNPTKLKYTIYLIASTILGILLSFIAHAVIEINYLNWAQKQGIAVTFYNGCALLPSVQISLLLLGTIGGFFLGRLWWHKIYIEKLWTGKK